LTITWNKMKAINIIKNTRYDRRIKKISFFCFTFLISLIATVVEAEDQYPAFSVKGFGSIGYTRTDTDQIGFYRNRTQTQEAKKSLEISTDSRLGIQLDVDISKSLQASTQFILRDHAGDFLEQNLDSVYLRWYLTEDTSIRLGRMGADSFLLSDYRNVGYAYPWMRPPHEFYSNIPITHYDGIDVTKFLSLGNNYLSLKAFAGYTSTNLSEEYANLELEGPIAGANIVYESENWRTRVGYTYIRQVKEIQLQTLRAAINDPLTNSVIPGISDLTPLLSVKDSNLHFISLGTTYDDGTWLVHTEASYIDTQNIFNPDVASAYLSIGRRFSTLTLYTLYGISHSFHKKHKVPDVRFPVPALIALQQATDSAINDNGTDEQSLSLGLRWDLHPKVAFKAQWSHYWLADDGASLWQKPASRKIPDNVNVISFGFDFIF